MSMIPSLSCKLGLLAMLGGTAVIGAAGERRVVAETLTIERIGGQEDVEAQPLTMTAKLVESVYQTVNVAVKVKNPPLLPDWFDVFGEATDAERAQRFVNTVQGLSYSAAYLIFSDKNLNFMSSRPDSWEEFEAEMRLAQSVITTESFFQSVCVDKKGVNESLLFGAEEVRQIPRNIRKEIEKAKISATVRVTFKDMDLTFPEYEKISLVFDGTTVKVLENETELHQITGVKVEDKSTKKSAKEFEVEIIGARKR